MIKLASLWEEHGLIFATKTASLINPSTSISVRAAPEARRLVPGTFHNLRHTCASLLFSKNVHPKFVQELLGHAYLAITLDTYSHILPGMSGEATDAMGETLS